MKKVLLVNPEAGSHDPELLEKIRGTLGSPQTVVLNRNLRPDAAARQALAEGAAGLVVAGGDGTVEAAAAALIGSDVPLGIIPMGTYNNFARSLELPLEPEKACEVIAAGRTRKIDVGFCNGKPFFECAGAGLDAALFPLGEEIKSGAFARWIDLFHKAFRYRRHRFEITLDRPACETLVRAGQHAGRRLHRHYRREKGTTLKVSALMVTVSNGPYYGMTFTVAPGQRLDDGFLTVSIFSRYSKMDLAWHFLSIAFGQHHYCPKMVSFRSKKVILTAPHKLAVHLDGNPSEVWPLELECRPGCLRVFGGKAE